MREVRERMRKRRDRYDEIEKRVREWGSERKKKKE